ncbi:hypothetical protein EYZ11_003484 [Aspergillus tanneri]|uniref:Major facilitator superfamily (MFS) profile domain-containing protein n=1 Tax=Aspergillus tanneri TaxID=1220188 RepID=A0A4S3JTH6_9EURO|nr:hypothetical protein EYZ11_003484 [Aspergillus tanneri]
MAQFHSTNTSLAGFVTTIFLLGCTFGPIAIAPLSEIYRRAILYKACMVLFIVFNVNCAVANSLGSLVVYRLLAGIIGSCPATLGAGSIADIIPVENRAGAMAAYVIRVLGPSIDQFGDRRPVKPGHLVLLLSIVVSTTGVWTWHDDVEGESSLFSSSVHASAQTPMWIKATMDVLMVGRMVRRLPWRPSREQSFCPSC